VHADLTTLLKMTAIAKSFAGVQALHGASFELRAGEVHALVGENGAGKSTLIKIITGAHQADAGSLWVQDRLVERNDPALARALGIAAIYQQPALFPDLTVAENMALGVERGRAWRRINWRHRRQRARELLDRIGACIDPETDVRSLTMPEQQLVEIARALGADARILIMDEPTASLAVREVDRLFRVIRELKARALGIIYISHRLEELYEIADRVTVMRDGKTVATCPLAEVDRAELIRRMVGREISTIFPKRAVPLGNVVLEARDLGCRAGGVKGVHFSARAGEILGFAGLVGAGRTELARVLFGLTPADTGKIFLRGKPVVIDCPARAVELGIAYLPEDRRRHGVILDLPIVANTSLAILRRISSFGLLNSGRERVVAQAFVERLAIKTRSLDAPAGELSGGNQQKVALARWLATEPAVLILDEPTQGVDVGAKAEIHSLMTELAAKGLAILMISSELSEGLGMSDRIVVMRRGTVAGILDRAAATQEKVLGLALGQPAERAVQK
jgi:rhamnose transport system ATP-binding protein